MSVLTEPRKISNRIALWSWGLMAFSIPFSTFLTILFSFFGVIFSILTFRFDDLMKLRDSPIILVCLLLFGWLTLSATWSVAPTSELLEGLSKYRKLLLVALIFLSLAAFNASPRFLTRFFVAGAAVAAMGILFSKFNVWPMLLGPPNVGDNWGFGHPSRPPWFVIGGSGNPSFGRSYISPGLLFPAALALVWNRMIYLFNNKHPAVAGDTKSFWISCVLAVLFITATFFINGRTGFLLFGVFVFFVPIFFLRNHSIFLRLAITSLLMGVYLLTLPTNIEERFVAETEFSNSIDELSDGKRVQLWRAGIEIGMNSPFGGVGVGGFSEAIGRLDRTFNPSMTRRNHAHSEYILLFAQGGLLALLSLVSLAVISLRSVYKHQLFGLTSVLILFFVDGLFNSVLWDLVEGHFFALIMGIAAYEIWRRERTI